MRRQCDVVIALDASADSQDLWFSRAAEYAKQYTTTDKPSRWPSIDIKQLFPGEEESSNKKKDNKGKEAGEKVDAAKKQETEMLEQGSKERKGVREKNPNPAPLGSAPTSADGSQSEDGGDWDKEKKMPTKADGEGEPPLSRCS
jgi:phospholipase A2